VKPDGDAIASMSVDLRLPFFADKNVTFGWSFERVEGGAPRMENG